MARVAPSIEGLMLCSWRGLGSHEWCPAVPSPGATIGGVLFFGLSAPPRTLRRANHDSWRG